MIFNSMPNTGLPWLSRMASRAACGSASSAARSVRDRADPLREGRVMSLRTRFKNLGNVLDTDKSQQEVFVLESPMLTTGMYERLIERIGLGTEIIDCTFDAADVTFEGAALKTALERIRREAEDAVRAGREHIILTDEKQSASRIAVPMILVVVGNRLSYTFTLA